MEEPQHAQDDPCPFCRIAGAYAPIPTARYLPHSSSSKSSSPSSLETLEASNTGAAVSDPVPIYTLATQAHLILSTKHILAFLDIMPLGRGHVLVITRNHWAKLAEVGVRVSQELGKWMPVISRAVMKTVLEKDYSVENAHWNVLQNNGERAAQTVPHVHVHVIPRPPIEPSASTINKSTSWIMFGRGQREELDDDEAILLARSMRQEIANEVKRVRDEEGVDMEEDLEIDRDRTTKVRGRMGKL